MQGREQRRDKSRAETRPRTDEKQSGTETKTGRVPCVKLEMRKHTNERLKRAIAQSARVNNAAYAGLRQRAAPLIL